MGGSPRAHGREHAGIARAGHGSLSRARESEPGAAADGHACAAQAHLALRRSTAALEETQAALASDHPSSEARYEAKVAEGRAEDLALDPTKSEAAYRVASVGSRDGLDAHVGLGRLLLAGQRTEEGVAELRRAIEIDPFAPEALYELGVAIAPSPESAGLLARSTRERPSFAEAWLMLGTVELSLRHFSEAKKAATEALALPSPSANAHILLGRIALADGRADDAIRAGTAALAVVANSAPAMLLVADGNARKGRNRPRPGGLPVRVGARPLRPHPSSRAAEACHATGRDTSARAFAVRGTRRSSRVGSAGMGGARRFARGARRASGGARGVRKGAGGEGIADRDLVRSKLATVP